MKSIAEYYERNQLDNVVGEMFLWNHLPLGKFMGTKGHELDRDTFGFVFFSEEIGEFTVMAYDESKQHLHVFPDGQESYLNKMLHEIILL
ncbi:TPA: hypothetical protein JDH29_004214 [Salmonella enterica subsp. houtenae]|nr:hypothetical protein [Salmonella enterica subsp. houtenae]